MEDPENSQQSKLEPQKRYGVFYSGGGCLPTLPINSNANTGMEPMTSSLQPFPMVNPPGPIVWNR
jgi:hypothetical protein